MLLMNIFFPSLSSPQNLCRCFNLGWNPFYQKHCLRKTKMWKITSLHYLCRSKDLRDFFGFIWLCIKWTSKLDLILISICSDGKITAVRHAKQNPHGTLSSHLNTLTLYCAEMYRGWRLALQNQHQWKPVSAKTQSLHFAAGELGLNPCYVPGKKRELLNALSKKMVKETFRFDVI